MDPEEDVAPQDNLDEMLSGGAGDPGMSGGDVPMDSRGGLDIAALLQRANTGAQGRAMPSYSSEVANSGGRIAKILERQLRTMENDKGYGRIAAALGQDLATGGKVPYALASEQLQGRETGQAVNLANAITGLSKIGGGDLRQMAAMLQRRTEQASRQGNQKAQRIEAMVKAASNGFDDSAMAQSSMYSYLAKKQKENPNLDMNELPALMSEAIMDARRGGLGRKQAGRGRGRGDGSGGGGNESIPATPDGDPDFTTAFKKPKTAFERTWNMSNVETRKKLYQFQIGKLTGETEIQITEGPDGQKIITHAFQGKGARDKAAGDLMKAQVSSDTANSIMDRIEADLGTAGASGIGVLGKTSLLTGGVKAQIQAAIQGSDQSGLLSRWLRDPGTGMSEAIKSGGGDPTRMAWLTGENSESAQRLRTNVMLLAYSYSKAMDPGGRIARDDVVNALASIGESNGDPRAFRAAISQLRAQIKSNVENIARALHGEDVEYTPGRGIRKLGTRGGAPTKKVEPKDDPLGLFQ